MAVDTALKPFTKSKRAQERYVIWLKQAEYDLEAGALSLEHQFNEWAAYQAEQAAEKALKAVIVHAGWRPPRVHKLPILLGMCNRANAEFRTTKFEFKHLESFTFIARYPFLIPGQTKAPHDQIKHEDAHQALQQARDFVDKITSILENKPASAAAALALEDFYTEEQVKVRLDEVKDILIREFSPEKIILFGRYAREKHGPKTGTIDILIIANTELPFIQRIIKARSVTQGGVPVIEPLIYTPEEFRIMLEEQGEGFLENALDEGETIYEKK